MTSFGERLREERKRLELNQADFARLGGVQTNAQITYEKDKIYPTAEYLSLLAKAGVDITYLFYGSRSELAATQQVKQLLGVLVELPPAQQAMAYAISRTLQRGIVNSQATTADADVIWRAANIYAAFLEMDERGRAMVEGAVKGAKDAPDTQ